MILAMVAGTVVSSQRSDEIRGAKYLLVEACSGRGAGTGDYHIALDCLGAGEGELVIFSQGSSARQTEISKNQPVDAIVAGIVDLVDEHGSVVFRK